MLKLLRHSMKVKDFGRNNFTQRFYSNYSDTSEYHFLDKFNYIGNYGMYYAHPQSSFIIRVTDDYNQCRKGNELNSNDSTCWWYFPQKIVSTMNNDFSEEDVFDIENELRQWKVIQTAPKHYFDWSTTLARCYAAFPRVPRQQKFFGAKQYVSIFYTDDAIEKLNSNEEFSAAGDELIKNLSLAFSGKVDQITDMNQFKGQDNIPDQHIEDAIRSIAIQVELEQSAKQLLKPQIYDLYVAVCQDYLNGVKDEKVLFAQHCPSKTTISEQDGRTVRNRTIAFKWILPTMMTDENTAIHLNIQNAAVNICAWILTLENDLIGYFKDKYVEFSPMSFFPQGTKSDVEGAKIMANKINEAKKVFEYIWENMPDEDCKHYDYLAKYVGFLTDYNFASRLRHANPRHGWYPQLDQKIFDKAWTPNNILDTKLNI